MKKIESIEKIIEIHGLLLLNSFGVDEKFIKDNQELLDIYINLLSEEVEQYVIKKL